MRRDRCLFSYIIIEFRRWNMSALWHMYNLLTNAWKMIVINKVVMKNCKQLMLLVLCRIVRVCFISWLISSMGSHN